MNMNPEYWTEATQHLSAKCTTMGGIIATYAGEQLAARGDAFFTLARAIAGQQISVKAANSIWLRLEAAMKTKPAKKAKPGPCSLIPSASSGQVTPQAILKLTEEELRAIGFSGQKIKYLKSLAQYFLDHPRPDWNAMSDEEVIQFLIPIKGIGRWTAEMFLIFHLLRPDVYPLDDIGLQKGVEKHFNQGKKMTRAQLIKIGKRWAPYRSVATWYLWRSLDPVPVEY